MHCPKCEHLKTKVVDTVYNKTDDEFYRRRVCLKCRHRFYTVEFIIEDNEQFRKLWNKHYRGK